MIKRTLCFSSPAYLKTKNEQLVIHFPNDKESEKKVPIEDIGIIVLENQQITISNGLMAKLIANKVGIIHCDSTHHPISLTLPLSGHTQQSERFQLQVDASLPLKKNLWQQTVKTKISNQTKLLAERGIAHDNMLHWAKSVQSGDKSNHEARAAAYYWSKLFKNPFFTRERKGEAPNALLNYAYAIVRALCARAIVSSGLHPTFGIHHKNKYNAYCLADDLMEPYRIFADAVVVEIYEDDKLSNDLDTENKLKLLGIPAMDVFIEGKKSPMMIAMSRTTNSLYECYAGLSRNIRYPEYGK